MSDELTRAYCGSCNRPIVWAVTGKGKNMPVDWEPVEEGNVELLPRVGLPPEAVVHKQHPLGAGPLRLSHFVTCPHAGDWRRR